jgi:ribose-phosphate pyrophosphokinase
MHIIGEIENKTCLLVDDMVDTAGTLCNAAEALKKHGAKKVIAYATHPILSGPAIERLNKSALDELVVTDSVPLNKEARSCKVVRQLSLAEMLSEAMRRISNEESLSAMFR